MRTILFFDLPTLTLANQRAYRKFIKFLKKNGFYMLQESVYVKMSIDQQAVDSTINKIRTELPSSGSVIALNVTEKQFSSMNILLGEIETDVLTTSDRIIILW